MTTTYAQAGMTMAAHARPDARAAFIRRTYGHLALAVGAFAGLEALLINAGLGETMLRAIGGNRYGWLMLLGAFMVCGWMARGLASNVRSVPTQYAGLALYVVAEAIIFLPILHIAVRLSSPEVLPTAAVLTGALFLALTLTVFTTRADFSFLRSFLCVGGLIALGLIVCSVLFGFTLGLIFSAAMVVLASAAILYDTSKILRNYPTDAHVAAALELFASVALLFWYILRIVMALQRR